MKKRFFSSFLIVLLLLVNFATSAFALQDPPVDFAERGSITVHKYSFEGDEADKLDGTGLELDKDVDIPNQSTPLPGTVYEIQQTHELVQGTNNQEEWVELVTPATPIQRTTDSNGVANFDDLDLGRYTLKEISAPGHLTDPRTYYIDVPLTVADGTQLLYDVHVYPKNTPVDGGVEFLKLGEDAEENALAGVVFHLFHENGTRVDDEDYISGLDGYVRVTGLATGSYYFKEVETVNGYLLNDTKIPFEIEEITGDEQPETVVLPNFQNYKEPDVFKEQRDVNETDWGAETTTLIGETVDFRLSAIAPTDIKEYVKFALSDQIDARLDYTMGSTTVYINDLDTPLLADEDYILTEATEANNDTLEVSLTATGIAKLAAGDTLYVEFSAVVNESALGAGPIENTAIVDWDNNKGDERNKESEPTITTPKEGSITITKVAKNDNELLLEGATFKLQRLDENGEWQDVAGSSQTTDQTGKLTWNRLVSGDYRLVETVAPAGYNLLANPIEFVIDDGDNLTHEFLVENMPEGLIPQTGGMGTLLFTVSGLSLMGFAGFNLIRKRQEAK